MNIHIIKRVKLYNKNARDEFNKTTAELICHEKVRLLDHYIQHINFTRLKHSVDVAYFSFYIAKLFKLDSTSAARAGLLHDLSFHEKTRFRENVKMLRQHPRDALKNALEICELNDMERDIIKKHMWLLTLSPPRYKEGYIVTFVDKYCAVREFFISVFTHRKQAYAMYE